MKLLTLNCHSWQEENQAEKIKYLASVIKEKQYDVIALQEVSQRIDAKSVDSRIKEDNFARLLIQELNKLDDYKYNFIWDYSHIGYDIYEEGLAILTIHEIKDSKSFYISQSNDKSNYRSRNIVSITIELNDELIDFYSCHAGWWNDDIEPFKYQAEKLLENISNERLSFIMGDFNNNALVRNEGYDYLLSKNLIDLYMKADSNDECSATAIGKIDGWEENRENLRLDLILSNKSLKVKSANIVFNGKNKEIISDHYGVELEIDL